jgi:hypothetical protein
VKNRFCLFLAYFHHKQWPLTPEVFTSTSLSAYCVSWLVLPLGGYLEYGRNGHQGVVHPAHCSFPPGTPYKARKSPENPGGIRSSGEHQELPHWHFTSNGENVTGGLDPSWVLRALPGFVRSPWWKGTMSRMNNALMAVPSILQVTSQWEYKPWHTVCWQRCRGKHLWS